MIFRRSVSIFLLICLALFIGPVRQVSAASSASEDEPGQTDLSFAALGMAQPYILSGPADDFSLKFNLPTNWSPAGNVKLTLVYSAAFSSLIQTESAASVSGIVGGSLGVSVNGNLVSIETLQESGDLTLEIDFNSSLLKAPSRGSVNELAIHWNGSAGCLMNLLSTITLSPNSNFSFSLTEKKPVYSLDDYPVPFFIPYASSQQALKLLIPSMPNLSELRAALIVAAGLGQLSGGKASVELLSAADFISSGSMAGNVILISLTENLVDPEIRTLGFTQVPRVKTGEGILQFFSLPDGGNLLLLSGDSEGIVKAAQAASAGQVIATQGTDTMVVSSIHPQEDTSMQEDSSLTDLIGDEMVFNSSNGFDQSFDFFIPYGKQVTVESAFNLIISHSQQLDYLRSGLQVKLNGYPVINLRLNDNTANESLFTIILPASLIHTGRNTLELSAKLNLRDLCSRPDDDIAWLRVSGDSTLHLPQEISSIESFTQSSFKDFPEAFLSGDLLNNVTFIVSTADFGSWQAAEKLAFRLGAALPRSGLVQLNVTWGGAVDAALVQGANLLFVGKPSDFTTLNEEDAFPVLLFNPDNTLSSASPLSIVAQVGEENDVGYLTIRGFSDGIEKSLLAVLGNTSKGVNYAADAVTSSGLNNSNFAVVAAEGVQSAWMDDAISSGKKVEPVSQATEVPAGENVIQKYRRGLMAWAFPVMGVLFILLVVLSLSEIRVLGKEKLFHLRREKRKAKAAEEKTKKEG